MKNSIEIRQERAELIGKADTLLNLAKGESRDFSADEQTSYDGMMTNIDKLAKDIEVVERQEKLNAEAASIPVSHATQNVSDSKELRAFSFVDAFNAAKSGRVEGLVREMDQEARNENPSQNFKGVAIPHSALESRANTAVTDKASPVEVKSFVDDMFASSVLVGNGATMYTGVSASQKIPIVAGITAGFINENGSAAQTPAGEIGGGQLNPHTIVAATNVSNAALAQNASIEAAFRRNFASAIMAQFEKNLLNVADVTGPTSIFLDAEAYTSSTQAWTSATALATVQSMFNKMISQSNDVNKPSVKLLLNGDAYADLAAQIAAKDGSAFNAASMNLVDRTVLNIPYAISANVGNGSGDTKARALMLDMEKIHLAMFGGLDVLVDPYSQSLRGGTSLVLSTLLDGLIAQSSGKEAAVKCVAPA
jgi:HK97 family phage major capsid protein